MPTTRTEIKEASLIFSSNLRDFIGEPANFTNTQLPTFRDAIKQAMVLQRENPRSKCYTLKEIMYDVYSLLIPIWERANSDLVKVDSLVRKDHIIEKMADVWVRCQELCKQQIEEN